MEREIWVKIIDMAPGSNLSMTGDDVMTFFYWHDGMRRNINGLCRQYGISVERRESENDWLITKAVK